MRKTVIFIADSLDNAHKFQQVLSGLDVDVAAGSSVQFKKLLSQHPSYDLVIYEARADALEELPRGTGVTLRRMALPIMPAASWEATEAGLAAAS